MRMALTGTNGDNQTKIGASKSIDFALYDESNLAIPVNNLKSSSYVDLWIPRDPSVAIPPYKLINATVATNLTQDNYNQTLNTSSAYTIIGYTMTSGFQLSSGLNVSVHIQIKPANKSTSVAYLGMLKFGSNPSLSDYDLLTVFCPSDLILDSVNNESYFLLFANISRVNGHAGYVGFRIRELNLTRLNCANKSDTSNFAYLNELSPELASNLSGFTQNFYTRIYLSGCYFINTETNTWQADGMEILVDSNITHTHCYTSHLTSFAGGFIVLPDAINFDSVWANASFLQNPVIYSTVIGLVSLYILLAVWARYMDWKDASKHGVTLLKYKEDEEAVNLENKYIYEIVVFTGNRRNAGTKSRVKCILTSERSRTRVIELKDSKRQVLKRGGIDSFILLQGKYVVSTFKFSI